MSTAYQCGCDNVQTLAELIGSDVHRCDVAVAQTVDVGEALVSLRWKGRGSKGGRGKGDTGRGVTPTENHDRDES